MIPYTSEDCTIDECKRQATALRKTGRYIRVVIRKKLSENGQEFARVYVERQPAASK